MIKTSALPPLKNIEAKNYYSESFFLDSSCKGIVIYFITVALKFSLLFQQGAMLQQ
jgi:hypothetical protein